MQCRSYVRTKKVMGLQLIFHLERNIISSSVFFESCVLSRDFWWFYYQFPNFRTLWESNCHWSDLQNTSFLKKKYFFQYFFKWKQHIIVFLKSFFISELIQKFCEKPTAYWILYKIQVLLMESFYLIFQRMRKQWQVQRWLVRQIMWLQNWGKTELQNYHICRQKFEIAKHRTPKL